MKGHYLLTNVGDFFQFVFARGLVLLVKRLFRAMLLVELLSYHSRPERALKLEFGKPEVLTLQIDFERLLHGVQGCSVQQPLEPETKRNIKLKSLRRIFFSTKPVDI